MQFIKSNWKLSIFLFSILIFLTTYFIDDYRWNRIVKHNEGVIVKVTPSEEGDIYKVLIELNKPLKSKHNTLKIEFRDMEIIETDFKEQGLNFTEDEFYYSYKEQTFVILDKNRLTYEFIFQKDEFSRNYKPLVWITSSKKKFDKKTDTLITRYTN